MKISQKIGLGLLIVLIIAQFFRPDKNEGELSSLSSFIEETKATKEIEDILTVACNDCHSNVTRYPWYSKITPVNYWMDHHVKEGKEHLNFSEWKSYSLKKKEHKMEEVYEEIEEKKMPLDSYTWTHADAKLTDEQINKIVDWAKNSQATYKEQLKNN